MGGSKKPLPYYNTRFGKTQYCPLLVVRRSNNDNLYETHSWNSEPQNIEQEISNDEVWNRCAQTFSKIIMIEYNIRCWTFNVRCSTFITL